jgi:hypothetical protein
LAGLGSFADSEGKAAHDRKSAGAGKALEAAIGVEPMMEVLQSSVDRVQE